MALLCKVDHWELSEAGGVGFVFGGVIAWMAEAKGTAERGGVTVGYR